MHLREAHVSDPFKNKSVLVTGGTGSFGKRFIQTVLEHYEPRRVIVFSRDELKQFEMAQDPKLKELDRGRMR
jgi:FlaA1/EpsC-like NDP-sugar epimerase